jgi:hypothetical protein
MSRCPSTGFLQTWNKKRGNCILERRPRLPHEGARLLPPWTPALDSPTPYSVARYLCAFWENAWLGNLSLANQYPALYNIV